VITHSGETHPERLAGARETRGRAWMSAAAVFFALALAALFDANVWIVALSALGCAWCGERADFSFRRARDAGIGACSERRVREALEPLRDEGWDLEYNVGWPGHGDVDVVGIAPGRAPRLMVAIETKTRTFSRRDERRTLRAAAMLAEGRRSAAVLVTVARRETTVRRGLRICSVDRLAGVLRALPSDAAVVA
jgi:hypothetical protein